VCPLTLTAGWERMSYFQSRCPRGKV
jgi:hypothetical protein